MTTSPLIVEEAVRRRYGSGAARREEDLCCPVDYDPRYLEIIPPEVRERDYGCGDPSRHLRAGETVLDLSSGGGKICFIAAQVVGREGRVIGVDFTPEMLEMARRNAPVVAERLGYANVEFRRGRIQDLALDLDLLDRELAERPVRSAEGLLAAQEIADEPVPQAPQEDPELWSGCISGTLTEDGFLDAFAAAGLYGIRILTRQGEPWRTVEGIEFRSVTVEAFKGKEGPCWERNQAVIYKGPFREVLDDDGHRIPRGQRSAVCDKTFQIFSRQPYREHFELVEPLEPVPLAEARPFDCSRDDLRHTRETKGQGYDVTTEAVAPCCGPDGHC